MYRGGSSRIIPALLVVVVIVVAIIALVAVGRALFSGSASAPAPSSSPARRALLTTDADHSVRMTVRGPLVAEEKFRSYRVDISPISRSLTTFGGYQYQTLKNTQLTNSTEAYVQLVYALEKASFLKEAKISDEQDDTRGVCATGRLYTFEIMEAQSSVKHLWTSSCRDNEGSFRGNAEQIRSLMLSQIPDSDALIRTIDLSL